MNSLNKFKNDLNNCSRCGLCQAVCPVFEITKNDSTSPKGKFILLNEMLKTSGKPSRILKKYMKTCLNCGKCIEYCPSKINIKEINNAFEKDFPSFNFNFLLLIEYFISSIMFKKYKSEKENISFIQEKLCNFAKNKKIVYLKNYEEEIVPEIIACNKLIVVIECGASYKFRQNNPELYIALAKKNAEKVISAKPDYIVTNNFLCKKEAETWLSELKIKKEVISLVEFIKKYLQV